MRGPGRSRGCYRCRQKKVKCDEGKPECNRCKASGVTCPGYRSETELVFCDMNETVQGKLINSTPKKKKAPSTATSRTASIASSSAPSTPALEHSVDTKDQVIPKQHDQTHWSVAPLPAPKPMSVDWQDQANCRLFADYVVETDDLSISPGFLNNLPKLFYQVKDTDNVLSLALNACALANFSSQVHSEPLLIQARKSYGAGLGSLHKALSTGQLKSDSVLAGVVLLNMYEMFSGDTPQNSVWETHGDALGMLLRARGTSSQFTSEETGGMARAAHRIIMFKNLLRRTAPGVESTLWEQSADMQTPWNQVHVACNRIARLLPMADSMLSGDPGIGTTSQQLLDLIELFKAEDTRFLMWMRGSARDHTLKIAEMNNTPGANHIVGSDFTNATSWLVHRSWNIYRAARILLLQTLLNLANRTFLYSDILHKAGEMYGIRLQGNVDLLTMVNDISRSTAEVIRRLEGTGWTERGMQDGKAIAGYTSIFPVKLALSVTTLSQQQRDHMISQLDFIERTLGLRQANRNPPRTQWMGADAQTSESPS